MGIDGLAFAPVAQVKERRYTGMRWQAEETVIGAI
jgi:hypothetical protein